MLPNGVFIAKHIWFIQKEIVGVFLNFEIKRQLLKRKIHMSIQKCHTNCSYLKMRNSLLVWFPCDWIFECFVTRNYFSAEKRTMCISKMSGENKFCCKISLTLSTFEQFFLEILVVFFFSSWRKIWIREISSVRREYFSLTTKNLV